MDVKTQQRTGSQVSTDIEFEEVEGKFLDFLKGAIEFLAGAFGGPIVGAAVGWGLDRIWPDGVGGRGFGPDLPYEVQQQFESWVRSNFEPWFQQIMTDLNINDENIMLTTSYVLKYNKWLKEISAYAAYYEFRSLKTSGNTKLLNQEKASEINKVLDLMVLAYHKARENTANDYEVNEVEFSPKEYTVIAREQLTWYGANNIIARFKKIERQVTGGLPPNGSNTGGNGSGTITGNPSGTIKDETNGSGSTTVGGSGTVGGGNTGGGTVSGGPIKDDATIKGNPAENNGGNNYQTPPIYGGNQLPTNTGGNNQNTGGNPQPTNTGGNNQNTGGNSQPTNTGGNTQNQQNNKKNYTPWIITAAVAFFALNKSK